MATSTTSGTPAQQAEVPPPPTPTQDELDQIAADGGEIAPPLPDPDPLPPPTPTQEEIDAIVGAGGDAAPTNPPVNIDVPLVTGSAAVGATLNCTMGNWEGTPTSYAYAWKRGATAIGTDQASYVVVAGDAGASITCVVTATNAAGSTAAPPSNAVAIPPAE